MADLTDTDKAYAAGLFDGEGCVELFMRPTGRNKAGNLDNSIRCALSVSGTDQRPLQWLLETFGGYIQEHTHAERTGNRPSGRWLVTSAKADVFAEAIHPYLKVKQEQIEIWMQVRTMVYSRGRISGKRQLPDEEVALRRSLVSDLRALKKIARKPDGTLWPT
jgi:hypothetical protein